MSVKQRGKWKEKSKGKLLEQHRHWGTSIKNFKKHGPGLPERLERAVDKPPSDSALRKMDV